MKHTGKIARLGRYCQHIASDALDDGKTQQQIADILNSELKKNKAYIRPRAFFDRRMETGREWLAHEAESNKMRKGRRRGRKIHFRRTYKPLQTHPEKKFPRQIE